MRTTFWNAGTILICLAGFILIVGVVAVYDSLATNRVKEIENLTFKLQQTEEQLLQAQASVKHAENYDSLHSFLLESWHNRQPCLACFEDGYLVGFKEGINKQPMRIGGWNIDNLFYDKYGHNPHTTLQVRKK